MLKEIIELAGKQNLNKSIQDTRVDDSGIFVFIPNLFLILEYCKYVHIFVHKKLLMLTTTLSDFRKDIKRYLDNVTKNFETLIINRGKDSGVVIMSLEEYNSLSATRYELSSKKNEQRLDSAISKIKNGGTFQKELLDE
ncbi:MAG: antitoxin YefM [Roseivirga sp.]